jgi:hypothetical protein
MEEVEERGGGKLVLSLLALSSSEIGRQNARLTSCGP